MSIDPRITAFRDTPNKSPRQNVPRRGVVLHGAAMTSFAGLRILTMGGKEVSANRIVKDTNNEDLGMGDAYRAWSLSSAWADSAFRCMECANESVDGYTISDESHWTMARNVADWALQDGFWPHRDGNRETWTVIGHREVYVIYDESYATSCPGGMDIDLVTRRAQELLTGTATTGTLIIPEGITDMPEPIYARGDQLDVWYALYLNAEQADPNLHGSGAVYSGRRKVSAGERAIIEKVGFPHPKQTAIVVIPQKTFDSINKVAYSE